MNLQVGLSGVILEANSFRSCWVGNEQVLLLISTHGAPCFHLPLLFMKCGEPGQRVVTRTLPLRARVYFVKCGVGELQRGL